MHIRFALYLKPVCQTNIEARTISEGCGTMGVAILSGTVSSLQSTSKRDSSPKWETHTSGTTTPRRDIGSLLPSRFLACVNREESVQTLQKTCLSLGSLASLVKVSAHKNVEAVQQSDVVLLWCASFFSAKLSL